MLIRHAINRIDLYRTRSSQRLLDVMYGPDAAGLRAQVATIVHCRTVTKSAKEAQYGRLRNALLDMIGAEGNCIAGADADFERLAAEMLAERPAFVPAPA